MATEHFQLPIPSREAEPPESVDEAFDLLIAVITEIDAILKTHATGIDGKASSGHGHDMAAITGLVEALSAKMPADKRFRLAELDDVIGAAEAPLGYILAKVEQGWSVMTALAALGQHFHAISHVSGLDDALTDIDAALTSLAGAIDGGAVPVGTVLWVADTEAPAGFLKANGAAVSRTTFAALFAKLGTRHGQGDGATTFNVPDLRGEFVRGWDDGRGIDAGRALGSTQDDAFKSHTHTGTTNSAGSHNHELNRRQLGGPAGNTAFTVPSSGDTTYNTPSAGAHTHSFTTAATGGTETRPRNVALLACIKY